MVPADKCYKQSRALLCVCTCLAAGAPIFDYAPPPDAIGVGEDGASAKGSGGAQEVHHTAQGNGHLSKIMQCLSFLPWHRIQCNQTVQH